MNSQLKAIYRSGLLKDQPCNIFSVDLDSLKHKHTQYVSRKQKVEMIDQMQKEELEFLTEKNKERNRNLIGVDKDGNRLKPMAAEDSNNVRPDFYGSDNIYQEYLRNRVFKNEKVMELKRQRHTQQQVELQQARAKLVSISEVLQKI